MTEELPADPFVGDRHPEELVDELASDRIERLLRGYERGGEYLSGFLLMSQWSLTDLGEGASLPAYNVMVGQDWIRTLGILRAAVLVIERDYLTPDEQDEEDLA